MAEFVKLLGKASSTPRFDVGVALARLNPSNAYHSIFEDMIPAAAMLGLVGNMSVDPAVTLRRLQERRWGLFVVDRGGDLLDRKFWRECLPEIAMVQPSDLAYRVDKLQAGTQASCAHWGHCQPLYRPTGVYNPPEAALGLRQLVFRRYGIQQDEADVAPSHPKGPPRVTLVQRSSSRTIKNVDEVVEKLASVMGNSPQVVDIADLSVKEQVILAHKTDIYVLVHGGALANLLWLPPRALVVDIYPFGFALSYHHRIVHWIWKSLEPAFAIGHLPFQIHTTQGQELVTGPLPPGCACHTQECEIHVFVGLVSLTIELDRFETHLKETLRLWEGGKYEPSMTFTEWEKKEAKERKEQMATQKGAPSCLA